ncbi:hypothetical protein UFOVP71_255 [uncultured Caudovirales phage]|uniref:Uncharacterized protein n=1 Tax=uncultured Caudovirales phage TaxID=2100421 RepID=A0A6J5TCP1_9CAUD|nr:hypothetical protein UFOVP71_255 [uncultured Caudovirales phage]
MKSLRLSELNQSYSFIQSDKPDLVWGVVTYPNREPGGVHGIPCEVIQRATDESEGWVGWGFSLDCSWLLFENQEDALMFNVTLGEGYVQH